ncbi:lantibiotic dehydratase C-terminal domain-containing protein [Geomicrobium sp. JCM 19055]|uniref:lantibiotic dehydratase C-terminal domain-containing protein n=1 Tax=Geomicrobium sp. JCM 19055 TaxID=1460649 RepID=UPI00126895F7
MGGFKKKEQRDLFLLLQDMNVITTKLAKRLRSEPLYNGKDRIIGSLIHMHCNRLLGTNRDAEMKVMSFVNQILKSQKHLVYKNIQKLKV